MKTKHSYRITFKSFEDGGLYTRVPVILVEDSPNISARELVDQLRYSDGKREEITRIENATTRKLIYLAGAVTKEMHKEENYQFPYSFALLNKKGDVMFGSRSYIDEHHANADAYTIMEPIAREYLKVLP